jgi:hypothetical protein
MVLPLSTDEVVEEKKHFVSCVKGEIMRFHWLQYRIKRGSSGVKGESTRGDVMYVCTT